jgi:CheY-like chemotaxis protein
MANLFYVHWDKDEALAACRGLREAGYNVKYECDSGDTAWKALKKARYDAIIISLAKAPSHGRQVAEAAQNDGKLSQVPIFFVGGEDEKVAETKRAMPGAIYCSWAQLKATLAKTLRSRTPAGVVAPPGVVTRSAAVRPAPKLVKDKA